MTLWRLQFTWLLIVGLVQLCTVRCYAASSTELTRSACDYTSENFYVLFNSTDPQTLFPTGYVECTNVTGSDTGLCQVCSCREKKVASVAGVTVAWVVCVGSGDATTCASSDGFGREFCGDRSPSSCDGGDSSSNSFEVGIINDSDASAGVSSASSGIDTNASVESSVDVGSSSSIDTISNTVGSIAVATPKTTEIMTSTLSPEGSEHNKDHVITSHVETVAPDAVTSADQNILRPSDNEATHHLDTSNGSSSTSDWSGTHLTALFGVLCGIVAVAAIVVFVALRKDQIERNKALGTPTDEYSVDDSSLATPMTHRLDRKYRHSTDDPLHNTLRPSIVVIGPTDDFHAPNACTSSPAYSRKLSDGYARTASAKASGSQINLHSSRQDAAVPASRGQFNKVSLASELPSSSHESISNTCNTHVSFSSSMSSEYENPPPPSERIYESEESLFRLVSSVYSEEPLRASDASTEPRTREPSPFEEEDMVISNTIVSFASSLSSLESAEYHIRDTEASEYMHPSELGTKSFDLDSISSEV